MGNSKLRKNNLLKLVEHYEYRLQLLDLMISDMSNVSINSIHEWLDETMEITKNINTKPNSFDEEHYTQLDLRDFC